MSVWVAHEWSPYFGYPLHGLPILTMVRGSVVMEHGKLANESSPGRFCRAWPPEERFDMPAWETYLTEHDGALFEALFEYLRIPSVSALPEHDGDLRRAATWVANRLRGIGVPEVELLPTARHPVVVGRWHVSDDKPTAMIYGHYDVQPADPLELWVSPPFEPSIRDDFYARGATDDKGNMFAPLAAVEALVRTQGAPPINLIFSSKARRRSAVRAACVRSRRTRPISVRFRHRCRW
jgi:hypothetical protein